MNILIISYLDYITDLIKDVIEQTGKEANIDVVKGTSKASYLISKKEYDLLIIDMMTQEYSNTITKPLLEPAMEFLNDLNKEYPDVKAFALFDEDETGKKGEDEIAALGYELADYKPSSIDWERKLYNYI